MASTAVSEEAQVKAIQAVNAALSAFAKTANAEHLSRATVQAALKIWSGEKAPNDVDPQAIESCDGASKLYTVVRSFVPMSNVVPVKVAIAHLKELKPALDDTFLVDTFGQPFCQKHALLRGSQQSKGLFGQVVRMAMGASKDAAVAPPATKAVAPPSEKYVPVAPPSTRTVAPPSERVPVPVAVRRHVPEPDSNGGWQPGGGWQGLLGLGGFFLVVQGVLLLTQMGSLSSEGLPWVGRYNASAVVMKHFSTIEAAHRRALVNTKWRTIQTDVNLTVQTATGDGVKYTRLTVLLDKPPSSVAQAFQSYRRFDELHKVALPFYTGAEMLLTPSQSVSGVLKASGAAILPLIPGVETTFALVSTSNRVAVKVEQLKVSTGASTPVAPLTLKVESGTRMAAVISVNSAAAAVGTCSAPAPTAKPAPNAVVDMCDKVGQILLANSSVCSTAVKTAGMIKSPAYYFGKTHGATQASALKLCKKSEQCAKIVNAVFHQLANFGAIATSLWSPPPVQTRVDAVYWFVPHGKRGTALVMVSSGINDLLAQSLALSYRRALA